MRSAAVYRDRRRAAGVTALPVAFAADNSSAAPPVACGAAIEVPWNIEYPGGSGYPACGTTSAGCHNGVLEIAEPGAAMFGLKPPSSRGPRDEKLNRPSLLCTVTP